MSDININISKHTITKTMIDIISVLFIIICFHFFRYFIDNEGELVDYKVIKYMLYITMAIILYHIIVKRYIHKFLKYNDKKLSSTH